MIHEITFLPPSPDMKGGHSHWAWDLPHLAAWSPERRVEFRPGLNVLFGRNGSGKTTILKAVATGLAAVESGVSVQTESWLREVTRTQPFLREPPRGALRFSLVHDGKPVIHAAAGSFGGLQGGSPSEDFFAQGLGAMLSARGRSSGERTLQSISFALAVMKGEADFPEKVGRRMRRDAVNDVWQSIVDVGERYLAANGPEGQPTILLDEPDAHWSFTAQSGLWKLLGDPALAERFQLVVASHSPFALTFPHANVVGLPASDADDLRRVVRDMAARLGPEGPSSSR